MAETLTETPEAEVATAPADDTSAPVVPDNPSPDPNAPAESTEAASDAGEEGGELDEPVSMDDAFREALAEASDSDGTEDDSSSEAAAEAADSQPPESATTEPESEADPPEKTADSLSVSSPDLERINTLVDQGRESELTPAQAGTLRRIREGAERNVRAADAKLDRDRQAYIQGETMRAENPEAYDALLESENGPTWLQFKRDFKKGHPEVTLEHPNFGEDSRTTVDRAQVEADVRSVSARDQADVLSSIATGQGMTQERYKELETETGGGYAMIPHLVAEGIKEGLAKALPEVQETERVAAQKEAAAAGVAAARIPRQGDTNKAPGKQASAGYDDIGQAFLEARSEMEAAGRL